MKLRLGVLFDRVLAVTLGIFIFGLTGIVLSLGDGVAGFLSTIPIAVFAAVPPSALLWISRTWSLFAFSLIGIPWSFGAYVICDMAPPGGATEVLHVAHDSGLWWIAYGVLRGLICYVGGAIEADSAKEQTPASSVPHHPTHDSSQQS